MIETHFFRSMRPLYLKPFEMLPPHSRSLHGAPHLRPPRNRALRPPIPQPPLFIQPLHLPSSTPFELRDYQIQALENVHEAIGRGITRPAVVLATGGGKTVVFSHLIPQLKPSSPSKGNKTLVLAHKEELVRQAAESIKRVNPHLKVDIDMRKQKPSSDADVVVGSVPTLVRLTRLEMYNPEEYKAIILDECHHATALSWLKILKHFDADKKGLETYVVGFTATMERSDGKPLGDMFDEVVFERNLLTMVNNKELVDIRFSSIAVDVDLSKVATRGPDYATGSLSSAMNSNEVNFLVAISYLKLKKEYGFKSTLIFCVDVDHCLTLCGVLQRQGINAQYVTGETAKHERRAIIEDFKNGRIDVLCNVQVFTEGTDIPNIDSLFLARPTKSRPLLVQMIGRGLRLYEDKTHCHVVDIAGTRGTGMKSVPMLFSLPPSFEIHGKTYTDLIEDKMEFDLEEAKLLAEEQRLAEEKRRDGEKLVHERLLRVQRLQEDYDLKFTTFEGFMALEASDANAYESNKAVNMEVANSSLLWIRLEHDVWGYRLEDKQEFYVLRKNKNNDSGMPYFRLDIASFTPMAQRIASNFKCGNLTEQMHIISDRNLRTVLAKAEALNLQLAILSKRYPPKAISDKQHEFLYNKLVKKGQHYYEMTPEKEKLLSDKLLQLDRKRAGDLIFALKYSTKALWVRWELQRLLGPDRRAQTAAKRSAEGKAKEGSAVEAFLAL